MILLRHNKKEMSGMKEIFSSNLKKLRKKQTAQSGAAGSDNWSVGAGCEQMGSLAFIS